MTKVRELRDMGEEQIRLVWKDAAESLFKLRIQAQTEKLASPSEARKLRRTIARCQTILTQRGLLQNRPPRTVAKGAAAAGVDGVPNGRSGSGEGSPQRDKHAKKHPASGRAKVRETKKDGVEGKRQFKKQSQSGT